MDGQMIEELLRELVIEVRRIADSEEQCAKRNAESLEIAKGNFLLNKADEAKREEYLAARVERDRLELRLLELQIAALGGST